ncbi:MAG: pyridoxamine 5'-phosphate oxidase family protein [Bacteroidales bacterium]|jgi:general stress protein 26|nr:pyridoxamine 5'-phosphate oxidase family protein [Bacteroidales bacterium]
MMDFFVTFAAKRQDLQSRQSKNIKQSVMSNFTAKQKECLEVMEHAFFVELTTINRNGFPSTRAMLNLRNRQQYPHLVELYNAENNPLAVYLTTNTSSEKISEIAENGKSCLYYCRPEAFHGILLQGTVEHVTDRAFKQKVWQDGWEIYYPKGEEDYAVLRFVPDRLKTYANFTVQTEKI